MPDDTSYASDVQQALTVARQLAQSGVPIFLLRPDAESKTGYHTPKEWQHTIPDPSVVDRWTPGMAIAAVTGIIYDVLDVDPRNGGSIDALDGAMPNVYATVSTPSGGLHYWIKSLGVPKGIVHKGIDYQGGSIMPNTSGSHGRGFVFLPPTTRASKVSGDVHAYAWDQEPPAAATQGWISDESGDALRALLQVKKQKERSNAKESYSAEVDQFILNGIPIGKQHYILSRVAYDMVCRGQGDMHIMLTMRAILAKSPQDMADPWTDDALMSLVYSARSKVDKTAIFDTWMLEETLALLARTREEEGLDPRLPKKTHEKYIDEVARREARHRADAEEAAKQWSGLGSSAKLNVSMDNLPPTVDWLIPGMLGSHHNFLLIGKFKSGKTTLLASLLRSLLDGYKFLDHFDVSDTAADKRIGIWNGEMDDDEFISYMKNADIRNGHMAEVMHLRGKNVPFMHNQSAREETIEWLASNNIKVWIIDSMTRLAAWNKVDKKDGSIDQLCNEIDLIKEEAGVECVILLTHTPKNEEEGKETAYGAQELQAWADSWWILTTDNNKRFISAEGRKVYLEETALDFDPVTGLMTLSEGNRADVRQKMKDQAQIATEIAVKSRVLEYVRDNPDCSSTDIRDGVQGATSVINNMLKQLTSEGSVSIVLGAKGKKLHRCATPQG